jgi:integrase
LEVLRCHWATDTNVFPNERQRVQLATILLFAAFTGSRPGALLAIKYQDLDLFVLQNLKTGKIKLMMRVRLAKTKSRLKQKKP